MSDIDELSKPAPRKISIDDIEVRFVGLDCNGDDVDINASFEHVFSSELGRSGMSEEKDPIRFTSNAMAMMLDFLISTGVVKFGDVKSYFEKHFNEFRSNRDLTVSINLKNDNVIRDQCDLINYDKDRDNRL